MWKKLTLLPLMSERNLQPNEFIIDGFGRALGVKSIISCSKVKLSECLKPPFSEGRKTNVFKTNKFLMVGVLSLVTDFSSDSARLGRFW